MKNKEFKVGDKCFIGLTVCKLFDDNNAGYPMIAINEFGDEFSFLKDGRFDTGDNGISLKHIEELQEYPKWMLVSNTGNKSDYHIRKVMLLYNNRYYAVRNAANEEMLKEETRSNLKEWALAKEIEIESYVHKTMDETRFEEIENQLAEVKNMLAKLIKQYESKQK